MAITAGLRLRGIDVLTSAEDGIAELDDDGVLQRATELQQVVFTQDDDFLVLADRWKSSSREFAGLVYTHQLAVTIGAAIRDLEVAARVLEPPEMRNEVLFLPI